MSRRALRSLLAMSALCTIACAPAPGRGASRFPAGEGGAPSADSGAGVDATPSGDAEARDLSLPLDAAISDDVGADAGIDDAGIDDAGRPDLGIFDAGGPPDAGPPPGEVRLRATGCTPDFGGELFVASNGSLALAFLRGGRLATSLQFDLSSVGTGTHPVSTEHRVATGMVVNLVDGTTFTNIAQDPRVYTGEVADPIRGEILVSRYAAPQGRIELELRGVTLQNVADDRLCTLDGTVRTTRLGR